MHKTHETCEFSYQERDIYDQPIFISEKLALAAAMIVRHSLTGA